MIVERHKEAAYSPEMAVALLEARDVCRYYHVGRREEVRALDGVSVAVLPGSLTVIRGPSGSGKTTLLALLGAMDRPSRGEVLFEGRVLSRCSDAELARVRRRMGFIFQGFALIPGMPAWENVAYPLVPRGLRRSERRRRAHELLTRVGLSDKRGKKPEELSGGEQQRVAVARALAGRPDVLLADEPTSNLDLNSSDAIVSLLEQLHGEGKTVIVATHDPRLVRQAAEVIELKDGKQVE